MMGMGFDTKAVNHVGVLAECHEMVTVAHLISDHEIPSETLIKEIKQAGSSIMLHMSLHGEVIQVENE